MLILLFGLLSGNALAEDFDVALELDETPAEIIDYTANTGTTGDSFLFSFNITDFDAGGGNGSGIFTAFVYYWYPSTDTTVVGLINTVGDYYNQTIMLSSTAHNMTYYIEVYDNALNVNTTSNSTVAINDNDPPEFGTIQAAPYVAVKGTEVNVTAVVTDNWNVSAVKIIIPSLGINQTMNNVGSTYYHQQIYNVIGTYQYRIWANDTGGNSNISTINTFQIIESAYIDNIVFKLFTPLDIHQNDTGILLMEVIEYSGEPKQNMSLEINCFIKFPDGTILINGPNPYEDAPGIYILNFTVNDTLGLYHCWATIEYASNLTYFDAGLFKVKWSERENATELYRRIRDIEFLGTWDRYNMTGQMAYHFGLHKSVLINITRTSGGDTFLGKLRQTAMSQAINVLFWIIVLTSVSFISALYVQHKRTKSKEVFSPTEITEKILYPGGKG